MQISLGVRFSNQHAQANRLEMGRMTVLLVVVAVALAMSGCGGGNEPKREVLRSANPLSADVYVLISGPAGVVDYIAGHLGAGNFAKYGHGVFLPPRVRRHRRQKVCSIAQTISKADSLSLRAWRGRTARVEVFGDSKSSEAIFCKIIPFVLAQGS